MSTEQWAGLKIQNNKDDRSQIKLPLATTNSKFNIYFVKGVERGLRPKSNCDSIDINFCAGIWAIYININKFEYKLIAFNDNLHVGVVFK